MKISIVSYLNSKPFLYGLKHFQFPFYAEIQEDIPSVCAAKLLQSEADIGLIPAAVFPKLQQYQIISSYCIGAIGKVHSVCLYAHRPMNEIENIILDFHSRTSVMLTRVIMYEYFKQKVNYIAGDSEIEKNIQGKTAGLIIGDRTFGLEKKYPFVYDLSELWQSLTGLPFVFAVWAGKSNLSKDQIELFNSALTMGINNKWKVIEQEKNNYNIDVAQYLNQTIQYTFDSEKQKAMQLFLNKIEKYQGK
jgi:chorismate dehydratase